MAFRMKVEDVFAIGARTVFTGDWAGDSDAVEGVECYLEIDGQQVSELLIGGEVNTGKPFRDLWTKSHVDLAPEVFRDREVWLISK